MKLLTIAVPAYNCEKTLAATIASLCAARCLASLDIVVVDDGSTDATPAIAADFCARCPESVRLLRKRNGGHGSAVNAGIAAARGRYFKVVDGDDRLDREGLDALVSRLEGTTADLVAAGYIRVLPDGREESRKLFRGVQDGHLYDFGQLPHDGTFYFGIHSSTFKTELLQNGAVTLSEHTFFVDAEYALLPMPYVKTVEFLNTCVYLYSVGGARQSTGAANFVRRYDDHLRVVKRLAAFAGDCETDACHRDYLYSAVAKLCFTQYMLAVYYDEDARRGAGRARAFDAWLQNDARLYAALARSLTIRLLRVTRFRLTVCAPLFKKAARRIHAVLKRITRKNRLTY